jgi:hypothetical protein
MKSVVYFIRGGEFIKIGIAQDVASRLAALATASPYPLEIVATVPGGIDLERTLHLELDDHRVNLEWFSDCLQVHAVMHRVVRDLGGTFNQPRTPLPTAAPASRAARPWEGMDFESLDALTQTISEVSDRFTRLIDSPAAQDARRVREIERQLGLSYDELMGRLYQCEQPAERYAASIRLVRRCLDKFSKVSDKAILDSMAGDMSRAGPLCHAASMLIERAERAVSDLRHIPGALAQGAFR